MSICLQAEYSTRTIPSIPKILCCVIPGFLPVYPPFKHQQEQVTLRSEVRGRVQAANRNIPAGEKEDREVLEEELIYRRARSCSARLPVLTHQPFAHQTQRQTSLMFCVDRLSSAQLQHVNTKGAVKQFEVLRRPQSSQEVFHHNRNL